MDSTATSILVFGVYLVFVGAGFLLIPNILLQLFGFPKTEEPWIRVMATLVLILAFFYLVAAHHNLVPIYWATVFGRFFAFLVFGVLVLTKKAKPMLILFGVIDACGAIWTLLTLLS
jgi:uncharacterized membrane protein YjjP (DUF1212 family)